MPEKKKGRKPARSSNGSATELLDTVESIVQAEMMVEASLDKVGDNVSFGRSDEEIVFASLDLENSGKIPASRLFNALRVMGILADDPRLNLQALGVADIREISGTTIDLHQFLAFTQSSQGTLVRDALQGQLVISDFQSFSEEIKEIYRATEHNKGGAVATYIPQLGRISPEHFAASICTIDGQRLSIGDAAMPFCIQSICKPINYCIGLEEFGAETVHKHVGREPSGIGFNSLSLNSMGLPHNPMINAGAIMMCSLIRPEEDMADRFDVVIDTWRRMGGGGAVGFNNAVYLSERQTADRNFALGYFMRENKAFPKNTPLVDTLEFYFQCCSIETSTNVMSVVAATLANGGICPLTGERVLANDTVKNCLSLLSSCGMYDFSGEFAFTIGLPAKSGVGGGLMVIVPNLMGFAIWSPPLDKLGNSVRGVEFCARMVEKYNFHVYDSLASGAVEKKDPRRRRVDGMAQNVIAICYAAADGDIKELQHLLARGLDINAADYDGRTAIHLAASEGHAEFVRILIEKGANPNPRDRWGNTPLDDARRGHHNDVIAILESIQ
ncbi:MAG: glutaminase A [Candidatus Kapaibacterium sp.]